MSNAKLANGTPSGAAPPVSPGGTRLTEVEYLHRQGTQARAAMAHVVRQLPRVIERNHTIQTWTQEHPFVTTGSAAGIGFLVGTLLAPHHHNGTAPPAPAPAEQSSQSGGLKATMSLLARSPAVGDDHATGEPDRTENQPS